MDVALLCTPFGQPIVAVANGFCLAFSIFIDLHVGTQLCSIMRACPLQSIAGHSKHSSVMNWLAIVSFVPLWKDCDLSNSLSDSSPSACSPSISSVSPPACSGSPSKASGRVSRLSSLTFSSHSSSPSSSGRCGGSSVSSSSPDLEPCRGVFCHLLLCTYLRNSSRSRRHFLKSSVLLLRST